MGKLKDITGQKFGLLTALKFEGLSPNNKAIWLFQCDCGLKRQMLSGNVVSHRALSCGCARPKRGAYGEIHDPYTQATYRT